MGSEQGVAAAGPLARYLFLRYFYPVPTIAFWAAVAACAVAQLFIIAGAIRTCEFRQTEFGVPRASRWSEIGWTMLPAIGLALVLALTYHAIDRAPNATAAQTSAPLRVVP